MFSCTTALTICTINLRAPAPFRKGYTAKPESYGIYMRQERIGSDFTQSDLALIFGVCTPTIDKWERGIAEPNEYNKNQIIEFLGYDPIQKTLTI